MVRQIIGRLLSLRWQDQMIEKAYVQHGLGIKLLRGDQKPLGQINAKAFNEAINAAEGIAQAYGSCRDASVFLLLV